MKELIEELESFCEEKKVDPKKYISTVESALKKEYPKLNMKFKKETKVSKHDDTSWELTHKRDNDPPFFRLEYRDGEEMVLYMSGSGSGRSWGGVSEKEAIKKIKENF
jgi:hypothetical protein